LNKNKKLVLNNVTLTCVSGVNIRKSIFALWASQRNIDFYDIKLVTNLPIKYKPKWLNVEIAQENELSSIDEYSHFCVYSLNKHINSSYILLVQADGYILNYKKWNPEFLNYDYIGAPWRLRSDAYIDPFGNHQRVGNGGFSLRSKRLLDVPKNNNVEWNVNSNDFFRHMNVNEQAEDGIICIHNRHVYENAGCIFATFDIALRFSREQLMPENLKIQTFGFHKQIFGNNLKIKNFINKLIFNTLYILKLL
jgi:hypothetical protein